MNDRNIEKSRYDTRAASSTASAGVLRNLIPYYLHEPYEIYRECLEKHLTPDMSVLEVGAGMGENSIIAATQSKFYIPLDISINSLIRLKRDLAQHAALPNCICGDMESMPFANNAFDAVVSAGSLSYANNDLLLSEIYRTLKVGGYFICVDSLNENPIYRVNRYIHYLLGNRSKSTLSRMPKIELIEKYIERFSNGEVKYFGGITFAMPFIAKLFGQKFAYRTSKYIDTIIGVKKLAFKFVLVVRK